MNWRIPFQGLNVFQKTAIVTIIVTFMLIIIGGIVRATGAGLGCPDWPRCFGLWLPPLRLADLPEVYDPGQFNLIKTWTEYINRLVGVIAGFLILLTFLRSISMVRTNTPVFAGAAITLVLVIFQGWLGGQVVRSGLESWMISVHMLVAILILNMLLWTVFRSMQDRFQFSLNSRIRKYLIFVLVLLITVTMIQVIFGTQVRESLDAVRSAYPALSRSQWINEVGLIDSFHRSFSWLVLILVAAFQYIVWKNKGGPFLPLLAHLIVFFTLLQIILGAGLVYLGIPPIFQLLHLTIAVLVATLPFMALLFVRNAHIDKSA